jgi:predicted GIY-YIG superfamily endonuclease
MAVYLLHFSRPYKHARHYTGTAKNVQARLRQHAAGRGARLLAVARAAGITWELARVWPGGRERERQLKRQGGASRHCPLCGVTPRGGPPRNRDGSLSRSLTTDAQKLAAGVMTAAQQAEHTALRAGLTAGRTARPAERGPLGDDPWLDQPAGCLPAVR